MFNIVLYQPEIPPNTGNIIRLCANTGCTLHLIKPLGFDLNDKKLRRAGLDYHEWADVLEHDSISGLDDIETDRVYAVSTKGLRDYSEMKYHPGDTFVFGPETRGLPTSYLETKRSDDVLRIPMLDNSRSLNLSNAVSIVVYEALRQNSFTGLV